MRRVYICALSVFKAVQRQMSVRVLLPAIALGISVGVIGTLVGASDAEARMGGTFMTYGYVLGAVLTETETPSAPD